MFAMIFKVPAWSEDLRLIVKTAADIAAVAVLGVVVFFLAAMIVMGAVYLFFAFAPYSIS